MKKIKNFLIITIFLYIILQLLLNNKLIQNSIYFSYTLFLKNVFPNLFPFLVISNILINYGFVEICLSLFNSIMKKAFKINGASSFVFIMSLLTGFPSSAKYTKELYEKNIINELEATKILMFTHFSNPLFVVGTISIFLNYKIAFIILIVHYLGNIIIGLIFRNFFISDKSDNYKSINKIDSFGNCFSKSIINSIDTLLLIFGTMTFFLTITCIIQNILNLNPLNHALLSGLFEFTQGLKYISLLNINVKIKAVLMEMMISFGGISVHMQVMGIISNTKIKYQPFLIARLLHSTITGLLIYLLI